MEQGGKSEEGGGIINERLSEGGWEETPTVTWERHLVVTKREGGWLGPSPLSSQNIYLSLHLLISSLSSPLSLCGPESRARRQNEGRESDEKTSDLHAS